MDSGDQPKRHVNKVSDYKKFNRSGDPTHTGISNTSVNKASIHAWANQSIDKTCEHDPDNRDASIVTTTVNIRQVQTGQMHSDYRIGGENMSEMEKLRQELEEMKAKNSALVEETEKLKLEAELNEEKRKNEQWHTTIKNMQEAKTSAQEQHEQIISEIQGQTEATTSKQKEETVAWLKQQLETLMQSENTVKVREVEQCAKEKTQQLRSLVQQQMQLREQALEIAQDEELTPEMEQIWQNSQLKLRGKRRHNQSTHNRQ